MCHIDSIAQWLCRFLIIVNSFLIIVNFYHLAYPFYILVIVVICFVKYL